MHHNLQLISITDEFHHCASVALSPLGPVVAGYVGQECTDAQRVFIWNNGRSIQLESRTGNPLIWNENGKLLLLYSFFVDKDQLGNIPLNLVQRWMYCDNYLAEVIVTEDRIEVVDAVLQPQLFGLLARCAPLQSPGQPTLLPLYREKDPECQIWIYQNGTITLRSRLTYKEDAITSLAGEEVSFDPVTYGSLGKGVAIQPTLSLSRDGTALLVLCRNVTRNRTKVWRALSDDYGLTWTFLQQGVLPNFNSSLVMIDQTNYVVYNDTKERDRILLMNAKTSTMIPLGRVPKRLGIARRRSFSYPNYCMGKNKNVYIVHTHTEQIALHDISLDYLDYFV